MSFMPLIHLAVSHQANGITEQVTMKLLLLNHWHKILQISPFVLHRQREDLTQCKQKK